MRRSVCPTEKKELGGGCRNTTKEGLSRCGEGEVYSEYIAVRNMVDVHGTKTLHAVLQLEWDSHGTSKNGNGRGRAAVSCVPNGAGRRTVTRCRSKME